MRGGINFYSLVGNSPTNFTDPYGLKWAWGVGGTIGIIDVNWNSADPIHTNLNVVTPQLGGGFNLIYTREKSETSCKGTEPPLESVPLTYSIGNRYLGISFADDFSSFSVNIGLSAGPLPINVSLPLSTY